MTRVAIGLIAIAILAGVAGSATLALTAALGAAISWAIAILRWRPPCRTIQRGPVATVPAVELAPGALVPGRHGDVAVLATRVMVDEGGDVIVIVEVDGAPDRIEYRATTPVEARLPLAHT